MNSLRHDWTQSEITTLFDSAFNDLLFQAHSLHRRHFDPNHVQVSTLLSIKTGACPEDCAYCSQSARNDTELERERLLPLEEVVAKARTAKQHGASRFCMGAAWRNPTDRNLDRVIEMVEAVHALGLETCVTLGMLTQQQIQVDTRGRGTRELTSDVQSIVRQSGIKSGTCNVFIRHTSASLVICENAAPAVLHDLETLMARPGRIFTREELLRGLYPAGDAVVISYQASFADGTVLGTSDESGSQYIALDDIVVPGLREALLLMNTGARWQVVVPPDMGFTKSGNRKLRRRDLIYDIELISIDRAQPYNASY